MKKHRIEAICREAGFPPEARGKIRGADVFVADGFSLWPHHRTRHFGLGPDMYPGGCYVTFFFVAKGEDEILTGTPFYCELKHNGDYDLETKKQMRINRAIEDASAFIKDYEKNRGRGMH